MSNKKTTLKDFLKGKLNEEEISLVNRSFEIVGDIAIVEIPKEIDDKAQIIGEALLRVNRSIKTVLKKSGIHKGEFRTQDLVYVIGENKKETIYKENGIKLKVNPEEVYFSPRLSTEREYLMENLGEKRVLVMFSGSGPYSFVALKKQPSLKRILSVEINFKGHQYALDNKDLNKNLVKKSKFFCKVKDFLKNNDLPIYEKRLVEIYNSLFVNFECLDVREIVKTLGLKDFGGNIDSYDNSFFGSDIKEVFDSLKNLSKQKLFIDFDDRNLVKDYLSEFLFLFSFKFDYVCKIDSKYFEFDNNYLKGVLVNYIEGDYGIDRVCLFDEIYMPLPKDASNFLDCAFDMADKGCIVHMYDFVHDNEFPILSEEKVLDSAQKFARRVEIIDTRKVGQYSPRKYRVCCDFKILD
jgi:tRNA G37 N-methylase Trm5